MSAQERPESDAMGAGDCSGRGSPPAAAGQRPEHGANGGPVTPERHPAAARPWPKIAPFSPVSPPFPPKYKDFIPNAATAPSDAAPSAAAAHGGADASSLSPPPAAPVGRPQERVRVQAGGGNRGGAHGSSSAAVGVVDLKGKRPADIPSSPEPSALSSAGSSPSNPFPGSALPFEAGTSSSAPVHFQQLFAQLVRDAEEEKKKKTPEEEQVKSSHPKKKKSLWRKFKNVITRKKEIVDSEGRQIYLEHVGRKTIPITKVAKRYRVTGDMPIRVNLDAYSKVRPVLGDGECFYRSFIFSYLEQVLDRQDTDEEHRLLETLERVSMEQKKLGWPSEFCRSYEEMHNCLTVVACHHSFTHCWNKLKFEVYSKVNNRILTAMNLKRNLLAKEQ